MKSEKSPVKRNKPKVCIVLPRPMLDEIDARAAATDLSRSEVIREALSRAGMWPVEALPGRRPEPPPRAPANLELVHDADADDEVTRG